MDLHEYQAKECFRAAGIPVPPGKIALTPEEAEALATEYGGTVVVKAQVHSGGRGESRWSQTRLRSRRCSEACREYPGHGD